jgi:hypothetical protein
LEIYMRLLTAMTVALFVTSSAALAQTSQNGNANKDLTTCAPAATGATTGSAQPDAMAVEKSAILPSAEGHANSAAPTVQREGQAVEARQDCPPDANQPAEKK